MSTEESSIPETVPTTEEPVDRAEPVAADVVAETGPNAVEAGAEASAEVATSEVAAVPAGGEEEPGLLAKLAEGIFGGREEATPAASLLHTPVNKVLYNNVIQGVTDVRRPR